MTHYRTFSTLAIFILVDGVSPAQAAITTSGDVVPVYGFNDPWVIAGQLWVGNTGVGSVSISAGSDVQNNFGFIGRLPGSDGRMTVQGNGSTWTNSAELSVGNAGTGTLRILSGGRVENTDGAVAFGPDSNGTVTVNGAGSIWDSSGELEVGRQGTGSLTIEAGGAVENTNGYIGHFEDSLGEVTVTGAGSTWTSDIFHVGSEGEGTLTISDGGAVNSSVTTIGRDGGATGTVTVIGPGSTWSAGTFNIGLFGEGSLAIDDGGSVSNANGRIGVFSGSTGTVNVSGEGSTWTMTEELWIGGSVAQGNGGTGTLNINPGGTVNIPHFAQKIVVFPDGLLRLQGGTLATAAITFQGGGTFQWTSGKLHIDVYDGNLINPAGGTLAPGRSAGGTTILGDYTQQPGAILEIEVGGLTPGTQHDRVYISNVFQLEGGDLQLKFLGDFEPHPLHTFNVLQAQDGIFGDFDNVANGQRLATADGLGSFLVHYGAQSTFDANQIVLTSFEPAGLPGDYNLDGTVDAADYITWRKGLGTIYTQDDYNTWQANFGATFGSGSSQFAALPLTSAIPEPTSALLLLSFAAVGVWRHRRDFTAGRGSETQSNWGHLAACKGLRS
jgi:T5SS/PEP-CTERM-associated repeat protein